MIRGGCLCGALRYKAAGDPLYMGYCCCADCRKASGSGYIGFIGTPAEGLTFTGPSVCYVMPTPRGGYSHRNFCPSCGGLVFGGERGKSESFTIYAGSLDDPSDFKPTMAIYNRDRPDWVQLPDGLTVFEEMPN
jgi:hypothetical protein